VAQINRSIISGCLSKICHLRRKCTIDLRSATDTDVDQLKSFWNFNAKLQVVDNARFKVPVPQPLSWPRVPAKPRGTGSNPCRAGAPGLIGGRSETQDLPFLESSSTT
jgi:hypothetical protein